MFFFFSSAVSMTTGGFTLQSYFGVQKSNTMDAIKTQINLTVEDPAKFNSPKIEMSSEEGKKTSCHRLRHRDMNILTPSGFWTPQVNSLKLPRLLYTHHSTNWQICHLIFYGLLWVTTHKLILFPNIILIEFPFKLDKRYRISYISAKHHIVVFIWIPHPLHPLPELTTFSWTFWMFFFFF